MTHGKAEFRYYAAFACWLVLAIFCVASARTQDTSVNEVIPSVGVKTPTATTEERIVICPPEPLNAIMRLLSVACEKSVDCQFLGADQRCCRGVCRKGLELSSVNEPMHGDLLGFRRKCPVYTFPERLPVRKCSKDSDCEGFNRICCPDKKDRKLYCRTAIPIWSQLPFVNNQDTFKSLMGYVQCQPPPPPVLDVFTRRCERTVDCLPNLCCQEGSKKVCRPAKKSILSLAAQATSRLIKG